MKSFKEIKEEINIVDVIRGYVSLRPKGNDFIGICPFHKDTKPSLHIHVGKQIYKCFACGAGGDVFKFIQTIENLGSPADARDFIAEKYNIDLGIDSSEMDPELKLYLDAYKATTKIFKDRLVGEPLKYFIDRGLSPKTIAKFDLGYCPPVKHPGNYGRYMTTKFPGCDKIGLIGYHGDSCFAGRLIFPLKSKRGNVLGFSGRDYDGSSSAKYFNTITTKYFYKNTFLYNYDIAKRSKSIYVLEGYMDVLSLYEAGLPNAVAICGSSITLDHLDKLGKHHMILALDNDAAGNASMFKFLKTYPHINCLVVKPLDYKDANELLIKEGPEAVKKAYNNVYTETEFFIEYLKMSLDLSKIANRKKLHETVCNYLQYKDEVTRDTYLKQVRRLLGICVFQ